MTPEFLACKTKWVVDDITFLNNEDMTRNPGREAGSGRGWGGVGAVPWWLYNEIISI